MPSSNSFDVMCVGLNAVDVLLRLPEQVRPDAKHRVDEELGTLIASAVLAKVGGRSALPAWSDLPSLLRPETSAALRSNL